MLVNRARRSLVKVRVQLLTEAEPLLNELPAAIRDQLPTSRSIRSRLNGLDDLQLAQDMGRPTERRVQMLAEHKADLDRLATREKQLVAELCDLLQQQRSTLEEMAGISVISAAELHAHVGDIRRFTIAGFARYNGTAPIPASSAERDGQPIRHRLNRGGNRQLNALIHRMAIIQLRCHPPTRAIYDAAQQRGHTRKEAMRILKRNLSNSIYRRMVRDVHAIPA